MSLHTRAQADVSDSHDGAPTDTSSTSLRGHAWWYAAGAVAIGLLWPGRRTNVLADGAIELTMIALLFVAVTKTSTFREWWSDIPRPARRTGAFVVGAIVFVQFFSIAANAFPLTEWTMYTRATPAEAMSFNFVGYTQAGDEVTFVPTMTNRTLTTKMATSTTRVLVGRHSYALSTGADSQVVDELDSEIRDRVALLVDLYNERSPNDPVVEAKIFRTTFDYDQRRAGVGTTEMVWTQTIAPGAAGTP